jgi:hypothetical protein
VGHADADGIINKLENPKHFVFISRMLGSVQRVKNVVVQSPLCRPG